MRGTLLTFTLLSGAAMVLSGCAGEDAASKANKSAVMSNREEVTLRLAHATEAGGDFPAAEKMYLQLVGQTPQSPTAQIELAEFYKRHRADQKAIASLESALKVLPNNTDIERELANTYIGVPEPEKALVLLDKAIATNSRDPLLYNSRGVALDQTGSYAAAQASYKTAFSLDPGEATMYRVNISMSYILSGSYDKAIALLRPMMDAPDAPPIVRQNLALAYGLKGDSANALKLGVQDLSESEAAENVRFYRMLAQRHGVTHGHNAPHETQTGSTRPVPASVVKELFPEEEPAATAAVPGGDAPAPRIVQAAPVAPVAVVQPTPKPVIAAAHPAPAAADEDEGEEEDIPAPVIHPVSPVKPMSRIDSLAAMSPASGYADDAPVAYDDTSFPQPQLKPDSQ